MKKRVLLVTPLPPPVHGSAMVSQYIRDSKVIKGEFQCDFVNLSTSRRMDEIGKNSPVKIFRFIGSYFCLLWKLMFNRYDLCYFAIAVHGKGFLKDAPFVLLCKLFGRKVLIHQHNKGMKPWAEKRLYRYLFHKVYDNSTVMLLSWRLYPDISSIVKQEQIVICPNGIPTIEKECECRNYEQHNKVKLFFLSNLNVSKGVYELLDACKILKERGVQFRCDFVGGTTTEINADIFETEARRRGIEDVVRYCGRKYGEDKHKAFCDADVFVQPTKDDCFPLTLLEACQYQLPIVSTDMGAVKDIVTPNENGLIAAVGDAIDLADKLEALINDSSLRERMGRAGYEKYQRQFTLDAFERQFTDILKRILA